MERSSIIKYLSWIYILFGVITWGLALAPQTRGKHPAIYAVIGILGLFWILAGVGAMKRTKWGFVLAMTFSIVILLAVPIGTVLGGIMGYCLVKEAKAYWRSKD